MWAVIHCLKTWGHYIGSKDVVVWMWPWITLPLNPSYLQSKWWQDTLPLFSVDIRHKPGKDNVVPDALNRKHQLKVMYVGETKLQKDVRLVSRHDQFAKEVKQNIPNGAKSHFKIQNELLWYKQNRLYVPERRIRDVLFKECHDGHLRAMVVQNAPQHSLRSPTIGQTWKTIQRSMWRLVWYANKIGHSTRSKRACYNLCQFSKGCGKMYPWISW